MTICSPTPTSSPTPTPSITTTITLTLTPTPTLTNSATPTLTRTITQTQTNTRTPTRTRTATPSITNSASSTPQLTSSAPANVNFLTPTFIADTPIPALSQTPTPTCSPSKSSANTPTPTLTKTRTPTKTQTPTISITRSKTPTRTPTRTPTSTVSYSLSSTPTTTPTSTITPTHTKTQTGTRTPTISNSSTPDSSYGITKTPTPTPSLTPPISATPTRTPAVSPTPSMIIDSSWRTTLFTAHDGSIFNNIASSINGNIIAATKYDGQIYVSLDSGASWTARDSSRLWSDIAMSSDGSKIAACVEMTPGSPSGYIYISSNSGVSWTPVSSGGNWTGISMSSDGSKLAAIRSQMLNTSIDGGISWIEDPTPVSRYKVAISDDGTKIITGGNNSYASSVSMSSDGNIIAIVEAQGYGPPPPASTLKISLNGGVSYSVIDNPISSVWSEAKVSKDGNKIIATDSNYIYISYNSGSTWTQKGGFGISWEGLSIPNNNNEFIICNRNAVYKLSSNGINFIPKASTRRWTDIAMNSDGTIMAATTNDCGGSGCLGPYDVLYFSQDGGSNWWPTGSEFLYDTIIMSSSGDQMIASTYIPGGSFISSDTGVNWSALPSGAFQHLASSNDATKLAGIENLLGSGYIKISSDSGNSWTITENIRAWRGIAMNNDGTKLAATVYNGQIYTSSDSGTSWTARDSNRPWGKIAMSSDGSKLAAINNFDPISTYNDQQIYISSNSGVTWSPISTPNGVASTSIEDIALSSNGSTMIIIYGTVPYISEGNINRGGEIYISSDNGQTWTTNLNNQKYWKAVSISSDGTKFAAIVGASGSYDSGGQIYLSQCY